MYFRQIDWHSSLVFEWDWPGITWATWLCVDWLCRLWVSNSICGLLCFVLWLRDHLSVSASLKLLRGTLGLCSFPLGQLLDNIHWDCYNQFSKSQHYGHTLNDSIELLHRTLDSVNNSTETKSQKPACVLACVLLCSIYMDDNCTSYTFLQYTT